MGHQTIIKNMLEEERRISMANRIPVGTILKNGAEVLDSHPRFVLAKWGRAGSVEFISWYVDEDGNTFYGHYTTSLQDAVVDFATRCMDIDDAVMRGGSHV
jgi:hypothetical protein